MTEDKIVILILLFVLIGFVSYYFLKAYIELRAFRNSLAVGSKCIFKHGNENLFGVIINFNKVNGLFSIRTLTGNVYEKLISEIYKNEY